MFIETQISLNSSPPIYGLNLYFAPPEPRFIRFFGFYKHFAATRLRPPHAFGGRHV